MSGKKNLVYIDDNPTNRISLPKKGGQRWTINDAYKSTMDTIGNSIVR